jgi:putative redox protein
LEKFDGQIQFLGELSGEQRQRLHEIAAKCPVHRILTNPVEINLTLAAG